MPKRTPEKIKIRGLDQIFGDSEIPKDKQVVEIPLSQVKEFKDHPFRVIQDEDMEKLIESIRQSGVIEPILVREVDDGYEIISGHRRRFAALTVGQKKIPALIRNMDDDEAVIEMVDANLRREKILPSEKAFAYKMKHEAMKHKDIG